MFWTLVLVSFILYYFYDRRKFQYFSNHGVPHAPGYFPFGSSPQWKMLIGKMAMFKINEAIYDMFPGSPAAGYYGFFGTPYLVINDLELAKKIFIKDFDHFQNRRKIVANPKVGISHTILDVFSACGGICTGMSQFCQPTFPCLLRASWERVDCSWQHH